MKPGQGLSILECLRASLARRISRRVSKAAPDECWPWTGSRYAFGHGRLVMGGFAFSVHRAVWELENGPIPEGQLICHRCDNPPCCNPAHLFLGTTQDNTADKVAKGRHMHGENHYRAKLTLDQVREIRRRRSIGERQDDLAAEYGVSKRTIYQIFSGRSWRSA